MNLTELVALSWLVFLAVLLVGCAAAFAHARPTPKYGWKMAEWQNQASSGDDAQTLIAAPKLECAVWISTVEPDTHRVVNAALVPLRHNTDPNARN